MPKIINVNVPISTWQESYAMVHSKNLRLELAEDNLLDKEIILLLSEGGTGKSTILDNLDAKSVNLKYKFNGFSIVTKNYPMSYFGLRTILTNNFNTDFIEWMKEVIYSHIGLIIQHIHNDKDKRWSYYIGANNDYLKFIDYELTLSDLESPIANEINGSKDYKGYFFDSISFASNLVSFLRTNNKNSITLSWFDENYQEFCDEYIQKYYEQILVGLFTQAKMTLEELIYNFLHLEVYRNQSNYLDKLNQYATEVNEIIKSTYPDSKFTLNFEEGKITQYINGNEKVLVNSILPYIEKYGKRYIPDRLSDSEKAILWTSLFKTICNKLNINLSESLLVFDEPDANIDPQYIPEVIEILSSLSKKVIFSSHSFITFKHILNNSKILEKVEFLKSEIDSTANEFTIKLTKIPKDNKKEINRIMQRLSGGFTISDDVNSYLCTFDNIYEDNIVGCEGVTDSAIFNLAKKLLLKNSLVESNLKTFLEETKFLSFFDNGYLLDGVGSCNHLVQIMNLQSKYLQRINKKIVAIFDSDEAGNKSAEKGVEKVNSSPPPVPIKGKVYNWGGKANKFFYLLHQPKNLENKNLFKEYEIEHLIYGKGLPRFDLDFKNGGYPGRKKTKLMNQIKEYLQGKSDEEILDFLSEFVLIFEKLFESLKN